MASIARALQAAFERCAARGAQLTELRQSVLELLLRERTSMTAYELRDGLERARKRHVSPVSVYRALDFLVQQGLVAHLARRSAYLACAQVEHQVHVVFACTVCGSAVERADPATERRMLRAAAELGFAAQPVTVEIDGVCAGCGQRSDS